MSSSDINATRSSLTADGLLEKHKRLMLPNTLKLEVIRVCSFFS